MSLVSISRNNFKYTDTNSMRLGIYIQKHNDANDRCVGVHIENISLRKLKFKYKGINDRCLASHI